MSARRSFLPLLILLFFSCAKQGMPTGGPKDNTPPIPLGARPENGTVNFGDKEFYIEFDEYIVTKDVENNILVSPPMVNKPEYKSKGKGLLVHLKDTLRPNTTYLFQFKGAIADFTEGNPLPSYEYVFSTGGSLDSMSIEGTALDALTLAPRKSTVSVWLLTEEQNEQLIANFNLPDSEAVKVTPAYATRCDEKGAFAFNYIRPGEYHVVAVEDEDKNLAVGATEPVGFADHTFAAVSMNAEQATENAEQATENTGPYQQILISAPLNQKQRITASDFKKSGKVQITSLLPMVDPAIDAGGEPHVWRRNSTGDTLWLWTLNEKCDSLQLVLNDPSGINDTIRLRWRPKRNSKTSPAEPLMRLRTKKLHYYDSLRISFSVPLDTAQCSTDSSISIIYLKDSTVTRCGVTIDSTAMKASVNYPFRQGEKYAVDIDKGLFKDIYGNVNDTLRTSISVTTPDEYGTLHLELQADSADSETLPKDADSISIIVQLLDDKDNVVVQRISHIGEKIDFLHLSPDKYRVRAIVDANGNGKWDTGDFPRRIQPESVYFMSKTLEIRSNWEYEEKFSL